MSSYRRTLLLLPAFGCLADHIQQPVTGYTHVTTTMMLAAAGEEAPSPGGAGHVHRQSFFEAMRSFLLQHFLSDADMAAEMQAGKGAAHYDMDQYTVRNRRAGCRRACAGSRVSRAAICTTAQA
jgi:hypothetical protein